MHKRILLTVLLMSMIGCSSQDWFELGQDYAKNECKHEAKTQKELEACGQLDDKSYEVYKREREEVINGS